MPSFFPHHILRFLPLEWLSLQVGDRGGAGGLGQAVAQQLCLDHLIATPSAGDDAATRKRKLARVQSRSIPPRWGSIRFRLAPRTYDAPPMWALSTCGEPNEINQENTH